MVTSQGEEGTRVVRSRRRVLLIVVLSWWSMIGFDFSLHAGLLSRLYLQPSPFLLQPTEAFGRIPLGYVSFLLMAVLLVWLMGRQGIISGRKGLAFGLTLGSFIWGALMLGLFSISTADVELLLGWFFGQTLELGIAGAVAGSGLGGARLGKLSAKVVALVVVSVVLTIALQSLGLVPSSRV